MTLIPRSHFDTRTLPSGTRFKQWSEAATPVWDIISAEKDEFCAVVDLYNGGDLVFGTVASSPQSTARQLNRIAEDGLDYYALQFYDTGQRRASACGSDAYLHKGDLLTVDMTQPIETVSTRYRSLDLGIPRRLLANLLKRPDGHGGRRHEACLPLVSLMRSHVQALYRAAPQMTVEQMVSMQGATIALAAAALNGLVTEEHAQEVRNATLFSIQRFIEDRLHDLSLSTVSVCRYFSISRATLYRIMEPIGGFSGYLRSRRLHRVRHDLTHPNKSHLSVGELAEAWGFSSHPSFTKSFRETFGLSPRAYRAAASDAHSQVSEYEPEYTWSHWLAAMK